MAEVGHEDLLGILGTTASSTYKLQGLCYLGSMQTL